MRAIVAHAYGSPDVLRLETVPPPEPAEGEVRLRVRAASVNGGDWHLMRADPFFLRLMYGGLLRPKHRILGSDVAGEVESVGAGVKDFAPGDRVFADLSGNGFGAFAEQVCAPASVCAPMPEGATFEEAAALPVAGTAALQALRDDGRVQPGQRVLINGASGGVGTFAVQIAKHLGAEVTGVCSTRNVDLVRSLGADRVVDYTQEDVTGGSARFDLVVDAAAFRPARVFERILVPGGRYVLIGGSTAHLFGAMLSAPLARRRGVDVAVHMSKPGREPLLALKALVEEGAVSPAIDRLYPLAEVPDAVRRLEARQTSGKVVITVQERRSPMWSSLSPSARRTLRRIVPFPVIWLLLAQVFLISDYAAAGEAVAVPEGAIQLNLRIYLFASLAVATVGALVGAVELVFLNRRLATFSLGVKLLVKTVVYVALLTGVILVTFPIAAALEMSTGFSDPRIWERLRTFAVSKASLGTGVQLTASLVISLFYAEISEHMGPRVLTNFLAGRYHTPKEERRVFLFSDMKASTTITERLGHARYFAFLRAYYDALADAIVEHEGEVYQYVGDEIVVSWTEGAAFRDDACLRCVARMKRDLGEKAPWFEAEFGVAPDFRAGLQARPVTTGEIGALKKEIVFTGDVLNQTARIQALCKTLGADVLLGDALVRQLRTRDAWPIRSAGRQELRGKERPVELFAFDSTKSEPARRA